MPRPRSRKTTPAPRGVYCEVDSSLSENFDAAEIPGSRHADQSLSAVFKAGRDYIEKNIFLSTITALNISFFNHGFKIQARDPKKREAVEKWRTVPKNNRMVTRLAAEVVSEWEKLDTGISLWVDPVEKSDAVTPFLQKPETCSYTDKFGREKLMVKLGISDEELREMGITDRRYNNSEINFGEKGYEHEHFSVLTRGLRGSGLGMPRIKSVMKTAGQCESMEVGESLYAFAGRHVIRQHKIGFEAKHGISAQRQADYLYKKDRAKPLLDSFKGKVGFTEFISQFDHSIGHVWIDPKNYDGKKWATIIERMAWYGGPIAFMLLAKSVSPYQLTILKNRITYDRKTYVGPFLEEIINAGFPEIPYPVEVVWSTRCFSDPRLAWEMVKFLFQSGPLSAQTALREADFDSDAEEARKKEEAKPEMDAALLPKWDSHHGLKPGKTKGRTPGVGDGQAEQ
jgi:hypothetical protein